MRKTYKLTGSAHKPARIIDSIRSDIRKYLKRERAKELPRGMDFWDFDAKSGQTEDTASDVHISKLGESLDETWPTAYIEINTVAKARQKKQK